MRLCEDGKAMLGKGKFLVDANEPDGKLILTKNQDTPCSDSECDRDWPEFVMFMLNALLYLCSENAEIRENAVTKNTYRPSNRVRNRFSEIRKMDCGFVYGSEVRKHRKVHEEQQKNVSQEKQHLFVMSCVHIQERRIGTITGWEKEEKNWYYAGSLLRW